VPTANLSYIRSMVGMAIRMQPWLAGQPGTENDPW
jgi:hypothetical protein